MFMNQMTPKKSEAKWKFAELWRLESNSKLSVLTNWSENSIRKTSSWLIFVNCDGWQKCPRKIQQEELELNSLFNAEKKESRKALNYDLFH